MGAPSIPPSAPGARFAFDSSGRIIGFSGNDGNIKPYNRIPQYPNSAGMASLGPCANVNAGSGTNWQVAMCADRPYWGVEVIYNGTGSTLNLYDATAVAGHNTLGATVAPSGSWSVGSSVTVPYNGSVNATTYGTTGVILSESVARTDGGTYPILVVRTRTVANLPGYSQWTNMSTNWDSNNPTWEMYACSSTSGADQTTINQAAFTSAGRTPIIVPAGVKFHYNTPGISIMGIGDSIMGGDSVLTPGSVRRNSYGFKAVRSLQDLGLPFDFNNGGISGNTFAAFSPRGKDMMDFYQPQMILIPVFSPNDTYSTQANIDAQWQSAMALVDYAVLSGIQPILIGPMPQNSTTIAQDNFRLQNRSRMIASGFPYLDVEPIVSDGASPARWIAGLNDNGDPTHPGPAGNTALAAGLVSTILALLY